jgi:hypothetical protein
MDSAGNGHRKDEKIEYAAEVAVRYCLAALRIH